MLIILEGVDGAGKTTIADRLLKAHEGTSTIMHSSQPKQEVMREYEWRLRNYDVTDTRHLLVLDRWHLGELVYGPLYRGRTALSDAQVQHVELYLDSLGATRLIITESIKTIKKRLHDRGEDFLQDKHVGLVWDWYEEYPVSDRRWHKITSSSADIQGIMLQARRNQRAVINLPESYVGPSRPRTLFVMSHRNYRMNCPRYTQALVPMYGTREHLIMERLASYGLSSYGIMTICDGPDIRRAWPLLGSPDVVPLDEGARNACHLSGIDIMTLKEMVP